MPDRLKDTLPSIRHNGDPYMSSADICHQDVFFNWTHLIPFEQSKKNRPGSGCDG